MNPVLIFAPRVGGGEHMLRLHQWFAPEGERVEQGAPLAEFVDDSTVVRVRAPATGVLTKYVAEGCMAAQGGCIGFVQST